MDATKIAPGHTFEMECRGFKARLMKAERLRDTGSPHGLPPGYPIPIYQIDSLPGCPKSWVRGAGSYICPIDVDEGLWFDWCGNDQLNTAIVPSVKGMNPITGQKMTSPTLEQYNDKCPKHDIPFINGTYCEKCEYKWPVQNYIAAPNTLWWDGFRQSDGTVRQFFFTDDDKRDIASAVIGKKSTVPAFGFMFYETKQKRIPTIAPSRNGIISVKSFGWPGEHPYKHDNGFTHPYKHYGSNIGAGAAWIGGNINYSSNTLDDGHAVLCSNAVPCSAVPEQLSGILRCNSIKKEIQAEEVSVGAGAQIYQDIAPDSLKIVDWQEKPSAIIRLYFVFEKQFKQIVKKGVKDVVGSMEGYLKNLPVG